LREYVKSVRELENCLTRVVVVSTGNVIRPEHVARVLAATGGHKTRPAEILEISRPRLARLLEKYGLE
jgi:DNA-binding NtrC family response regulator